MPRFYFDVFDGSKAVVDDFGDVFPETGDAAGQAVGLLTDFASDILPGDGSKGYGVAVRSDGGHDVYKAVLIFRDACPDPTRPGASWNLPPAPSVPDPADLIERSREARRQAGEVHQRLRAARTELGQVREQVAQERRRRLRDEAAVVGPPMACRLGAPRRVA